MYVDPDNPPRDDASTTPWHPGAAPEFSIILGGPLYQFFRRLHIVRDAVDLLARRVISITLLVWLPLLIFAFVVGRAVGNVKVPFLYDIAAHARFLIALPLLIIAEWVVHMRFRPLIWQFVERDLISAADAPRFQKIITSSVRLRNSIVAEILLIVLVVTGGHLLWRTQGSLPTATWYADAGPDGLQMNAAGKCYVYWSLPVFQFILYRWLFRLLIWARFLWKVSRLDLQLVPTHPDRSGGLGFLAHSADALAPLLVAQSVVVAGVIASRIFFTGATLMQFKFEIIGLVLLLMVMALGPLVVFAPVILNAQRLALRQYGEFVSHYTADFHQKWIRSDCDRAALMGSADIQSLADLSQCFDIVATMRPFPFGRSTLIRLVVLILLPLFPLTLTVIPFDQLIDRLFRALL